jgi:hypothetical protein
LIGGWFTVVDGKTEYMPKDRSIFGPGFISGFIGDPRITWERKVEGHTIYNLQNIWCCETCMVEHSSNPDAFDAPRETYSFPTCLGLRECGSGGMGSETILNDPRPYGSCMNWEPFMERMPGPKLDGGSQGE